MSTPPSEDTLVTELPLPADVSGPVQVYVNGAPWTEGHDYTVAEGRLHFHRTLRRQPRLSFARKVILTIGIGVYEDLRGDTLDLRYTRNGQPQMVNIPLRHR
ncbi:MAG TPA: hypothetical protein PKE32_04750 [Miltoncostaeaceae bacterium]|nr:hypothetical protein [Miltoncostaeaceae bacterium]